MGKRKTEHQEDQSTTQTSQAGPAHAGNGHVQSGHGVQSGGDRQQNGSIKRLNLSNGSWRGKATAVAEIARESITAAAGSASASATSKASSSPGTVNRRSSGLLTPARSRPSVASVSRVNATFGVPEGSNQDHMEDGSGESKGGPNDDAEKDGKAQEQSQTLDQMKERPLPAGGWRGWWSRGQDEKSEDTSAVVHEDAPKADATQIFSEDPADATSTVPQGDVVMKSDAKAGSSLQRSSWFGLWGPSADVATEQGLVSGSRKGDSAGPSESSHAAAAEPTIAPSKRAADETNNAKRPSSGSWTFWSRESGNPSNKENALVVPENENMSKSQAPASGESAQSVKDNAQALQASQKVAKKAASKALEESLPQHSRPASLAEANKESQPTDRTQDKKPGKSMPQNLLLPAFHKTYRLAQTPSYWQQLVRMFGRQSPEEHRHLSVAASFPRIKNALAIGVHGYFPSPIVQKVLGPPTGTSVRFAKSAAVAIENWAEAHGQSCNVEMVALEGEGMVASRLDTLWKLLLNWIDQIRKADFILVACHSQGVPVACLLVEKLINFGVLSPSVRIGICAMAGVNLGPFASYRSRFLDAAASELFSFSQPKSNVSQLYASAVETLLAHHVRLTYIGSIDDQLVSMESSTFSNISHPYIYRAVFVDGRIHAPDFLTHLVGFALKLRNLGIPDHGLVRELSVPLAGSLYSGEGHSRIYHEPGVYDLAVQFSLETTSLSSSSTAADAQGTSAVLLERVPYKVPDANPNPFFLPWAMRGLLEEEFVRTELKDEVAELLEQFDSWRPQSKVLTDVRFRLEAVKSKL